MTTAATGAATGAGGAAATAAAPAAATGGDHDYGRAREFTPRERDRMSRRDWRCNDYDNGGCCTGDSGLGRRLGGYVSCRFVLVLVDDPPAV